VHVAVSAGTLGRNYAYALKALAPAYGFGFVDISKGGGSASAVGSYLSRYLTRDMDGGRSTGLPIRPAYTDARVARMGGVSIRIARETYETAAGACATPAL